MRRIGKHNSRFALVDERKPAQSLVIDSKRISEIWILVENRRYRPDGTPNARFGPVTGSGPMAAFVSATASCFCTVFLPGWMIDHQPSGRPTPPISPALLGAGAIMTLVGWLVS